MFEYEATGKTISKAIETAISELKVKKEDVDIKVIQDAGFLTKARVLVCVPDEIAEQNETIKSIRQIRSLEEKISAEEEKLKQCTQQQAGILSEIGSEFLSAQDLDKDTNHEVIAKNFVLGLLRVAGISAEVSVSNREKDILVEINGEGLGKLIGHQGETLSAIQFLCNVYLGKFSRKCKRVVVDVNKHKEKRTESLEALAHRLAVRVQETGKSVELAPMNAFERYVMHNVITLYDDLETHSEGKEPNRYLVISCRNDKK